MAKYEVTTESGTYEVETEEKSRQDNQNTSLQKQISNRPSAISDLVKNPTTIQHPLGAILRTMEGAQELYQGVPASIGLDLQAGQPQNILPNLMKVVTGQRPAQYGDILRGANVPEPLAAAGGLIIDMASLPGGGEGMKGIESAIKSTPQFIESSISNISSSGSKVLKSIFNYKNALEQSEQAKEALNVLHKTYTDAYGVMLKDVENVPTNFDFKYIPERVKNMMMKDNGQVYGVEFNQDGTIKQTVSNLAKVKKATSDSITPQTRLEAGKSEQGIISKFEGSLSSEMKRASKAAGKPIDEAMNAYGKFKQNWDLVYRKVVDKNDEAMANSFKNIFRVTSEPKIKQAWKVLSKESPELKQIMTSRGHRELLKGILTAAPVIEAGKKVITGRY